MRLLHVRDDHDGCFAPAREPEPIRGRHLAFYGRQHMPLWNTSTDRGRDPKGGEGPESFHEGVRPMSGKPNFQIPLEPERYELTASPVYRFEVDRRVFFKFLGAGILIVGVLNNAHAFQESGAGKRPDESLPKEISAWLHIGENGAVTVFTGKVEVGQNIRTSLAQSVADELRVPFESVRMVMGDTELTPFDMGTFGSRTTPTMAPQLRRVAAAARDLLLQTAAKDWNSTPDKLVAQNAKITDSAAGRSASYAEVARGKTLAQRIPDEDPVTPASQWTVAGKSLSRVNGRAFVTGRHQYTSDLRPAGVLYGKILRPPSFGATMTSCDVGAAKKLPAAVVVHDGDFV